MYSPKSTFAARSQNIPYIYASRSKSQYAFCCLPDLLALECILIYILYKYFLFARRRGVDWYSSGFVVGKWMRRGAYENRMNVPFDEMTPSMKFHSSIISKIIKNIQNVFCQECAIYVDCPTHNAPATPSPQQMDES